MTIKLIMLMESLRTFIKREEGASAIEYALIAGLIAVGIIAVVGTLGEELRDIFSSISEALGTAQEKANSSAGGT